MREQNFFYQNPAEQIGASLGQALFGNPAAAQAQAQARAEIAERQAREEQARAQARLYGSQADGVEFQNTQARGLPEAIAALSAPPPPPTDTWYRSPEDHRAAQADVFRGGLGNLIAHLAGQQGDKVDTSETVGSLASFLGGDELARRGMIAQGQTPGKEFAVTPHRADEIHQRDAASALAQAMGVAQVNHSTDIPIANIKAGADRDVALTNNRDDIPVARIAAASRGGTVALDGYNPGGINDGAFARSQPGYVGGNGRYARLKDMASGDAAQRALLQSYITRGYNTPAKIAQRWAPAGDGNDPARYAQTIAAQLGIDVNDPLTPADVDRFQVAQARAENRTYKPGASAAGKLSAWGKPPPAREPITASALNMLDGEIVKRLGQPAIDELSPEAMANLRAHVGDRFQLTGNPSLAVEQGIRDRLSAGRKINERRASGAKPPVAGARKAPDGKWYVQRGKKPDGSPQYALVEVTR